MKTVSEQINGSQDGRLMKTVDVSPHSCSWASEFELLSTWGRVCWPWIKNTALCYMLCGNCVFHL